MTIRSIQIKDYVVRIEYMDDDSHAQRRIISVRPHADFVKAMDSLTPVLIRHLSLKFLGERVTAYGLDIIEGEKQTVYVIKGSFWSPVGSYYMNNNIVSSKLAEDSSGFFEEADDWGELIHDPDEFLFLFTEEEFEKVETLITEAVEYINGKRRPDEQGDLFEDAEKQQQQEETEEESHEELLEDLSDAVEAAAKAGGELMKALDEAGGDVYIGGRKVYSSNKKKEEEE